MARNAKAFQVLQEMCPPFWRPTLKYSGLWVRNNFTAVCYCQSLMVRFIYILWFFKYLIHIVLRIKLRTGNTMYWDKGKSVYGAGSSHCDFPVQDSVSGL